jgi:protein-tyrosine phosphatase
MLYTSAAQCADAMDNLVWDGYLNARDLGGLPTPLSSTGLTVTGRIARGPRRERLTVAGWVDARTWGLAAVVDLRCGFEIGPGIGDPHVPTEALAGISLVNAPTEDQGDAEFMRVCAPSSTPPNTGRTTGDSNPNWFGAPSKQSHPHRRARSCTAAPVETAQG